MFARPSAKRRQESLRVRRIPPGTAMAAAITIEITTRKRCSSVKLPSSNHTFQHLQESASFRLIAVNKLSRLCQNLQTPIAQQRHTARQHQSLSHIVRNEQRCLP